MMKHHPHIDWKRIMKGEDSSSNVERNHSILRNPNLFSSEETLMYFPPAFDYSKGHGFSLVPDKGTTGNLINYTETIKSSSRRLIENPFGLGINRKEKERAENEYTCDICNRSFKTYQALGGHKAHHSNKDHKFTLDFIGKGINEFPNNGVTNVSKQPQNGLYNLLLHRCSYCYKIFPKGQALGGHKRHCRRPETVARGAAAGPEIETRKKVKVFGFDLNELPTKLED